MVRKATLDRGLRPEEYAADETAAGVTEPAQLTGRRLRQWRGAGGRWMIWVFRAVIWAALLIIGFRGVASIITDRGPADANGTSGNRAAVSSASRFPASFAEAFALQFAAVYLNFSPGTAGQRASDLTPFIPVGSAPQFGWNGAGSQRLASEQVASITVQNAHHAVVTLLAQVNTGLIELAVPVYAAQDGMVVSAEPALLPGPVRANPPSPSYGRGDPAARTELGGQLPGFFRAYASGDQQTLGRFLAPGAVVTGLGGAVSFHSIAGLEVPPGGPVRTIAVSVVWQLNGRARARERARPPAASANAPGLQMTYDMTVVRRGGSWYVKAIGPSSQQPGGP